MKIALNTAILYKPCIHVHVFNIYIYYAYIYHIYHIYIYIYIYVQTHLKYSETLHPKILTKNYH